MKIAHCGEDMELKNICKLFNIKGKVTSVELYGNGHINTTYLAQYDYENEITKYILQKINKNVFPKTKELMENIIKVTEYVKQKVIERNGNPNKEVLTLVPTKTGGKYAVIDGEYYRMYVFVEDTVALQIVDNAENYTDAGQAFGDFIQLLNDFPAGELYEVIENFHNTVSRYDNFAKALDINIDNRISTCAEEIKFVQNREDICGVIIEKLRSGDLPLRVTHNDTKLNNVLLDSKSLKPVCVIDLDTIMPGSLLYDFGDAIRSGCNTGLEDEQDLTKVNFDITLFESFVKGFLKGIGNCITENELKLLPFGAKLMTFECGIRFLTDYLSGDTYFKTHYPQHNLVRARTQFKLVSDMENLWTEMQAIVDKYDTVRS